MTKAEEIEAFLRRMILSGRWKEGQIIPGEMELLSVLGVSRATLRQALGILAAEGLLTRKKSSGTFVSPGASATGTIAITAIDCDLSSLTGFWFQKVANLARDRIHELQFHPLLDVGRYGNTEDFLTSLSISRKPNRKGLVGVIDTSVNPLLTDMLKKGGIPCVTISAGGLVNDYCIGLNYCRMMELAVEAFHSRGIEDFAVMDIEPGEFRSPGWEKVRHIRDYSPLRHIIEKEGRLIYVRRSLNFDHAYDAFVKWWKSGNRPNAIFFMDDVLCDVAIRAIADLRISVPSELSIITHANKGKRFHSTVPLTRIEFDPSEVANLACGMLDNLIKRRHVDENRLWVQPVLSQGKSH